MIHFIRKSLTMKNPNKSNKNDSVHSCYINNFEALMPLIDKYVTEHPEEYKKYLEEKKQNKKKENPDKILINEK